MTITLSTANEFIARHIGPRQADEHAMLATLGFDSLEGLSASVIPESIKGTSVLDLPAGLSEADALASIKAIAAKNKLCKTYIGQGYYNCHTPSPILRNLLENPAWYTAYTPYQPEISQGRLEALLNFQTLISDLSGLPIANASLLDEATAAAEAMTFCKRLSKNKTSHRFFASSHCHPQTLDVLRTRAEPLGIEVVVADERELNDVTAFFGALLQYPASNGDVFDYRELVERFHTANALVAVAADLLALTLLTPPGEFGADVAIGSAQRFGVPLGFGGPHAAYFATRDAYKRDMPGRLVGVSVDRHGKPALRLAMQTREQHIRREKATSNICTAQVLLANIASMYAVYHGPKGLIQIAQRIHQLTAILAQGLSALGLAVEQTHFFDTLTLNTGDNTAALHDRAHAQGINLRVIDDQHLGLSLDETSSESDVVALWALFAADGQALPDFDDLANTVSGTLPEALLRQSPILSHPVFNRYHSETELMRYLRKLADKDLALDLVWGYAGLLSLGHGLFFALGGYAMGMYLMRQASGDALPDFMTFLSWSELPWYWVGTEHFWWAMCLVVLAPGLLALVFGFFAFRSRIKGVYFSIMTQALTFAGMLLFFRNETGFGGNNGFTNFRSILGFGITEPGTRAVLFLATAAMALVGIVIVMFMVPRCSSPRCCCWCSVCFLAGGWRAASLAAY